MKAVESGNVEEQQRLVDEAAEKWSDGNEVYVTDNETGEAIFKFYRSADDGRTVWDGNGHNQNKGVFLTSNEYIADAFNYGRGDTSVKHITVYAKAENPSELMQRTTYTPVFPSMKVCRNGYKTGLLMVLRGAIRKMIILSSKVLILIIYIRKRLSTDTMP